MDKTIKICQKWLADELDDWTIQSVDSFESYRVNNQTSDRPTERQTFAIYFALIYLQYFDLLYIV